MSASLKHYLQTIENSFKAGNATEHTHRPALKTLLEALDPHLTATNEPKRIACGAPDYIISRNQLTIGYIEAKDVGKSLYETERSDQLKRYRRALDNLILTDYLDFRWYVDGNLRQEARLATPQPGGKVQLAKEGLKTVGDLLHNFLAHQPQEINSPKELAQRMARLTHIVRDIIITAFEREQASNLLRGWREAFAKVLIADLGLPDKTADFADMFAQTLAYGLFTARVMDTTPKTFTRHEAQYLIPKSNPFLRDFFIQITGPQLDDEPFASFVDDLVNLLANTDMTAVLTHFGRRTRQEDPIVHFYETFLAAYDPRLREARGVYYTPEPVVSYIVRSVDVLLKSRFNCPAGLADSSKITIANPDPGLMVKGKKQPRKTSESHKVLVLDPATGTGTFLYAVIDHIRQQFMHKGDAGMWPGYVKHHLLPRLFGFELLMAPYAVAHFKLSLQLAGRDLPANLSQQWTYQPGDGERLGIYLTNALEEPHEMTGLPLFTQWVADETNAANEVKQRLPVLVVMGNPPYSGHSANKSNWIDSLLKGKLPDGSKTGNYYEVDGQPLGERNPKWLQNDYVKFIRFGQWRIEQSGHGILAFITDHSYLNSPTFRGMRQQLIQSFSDVYIFNLHGNSTIQEVPPDDVIDENVFDIQQGVTIGIFVKYPKSQSQTTIHYADLWGKRKEKYEALFSLDLSSTEWEILEPQPPFYLFVPQNTDLLPEYQAGWRITEIISVHSMGVTTGRDSFATDYSRSELANRISVLNSSQTNEEIRTSYRLKDSSSFSLDLARAWAKSSNTLDAIIPFDYRCFDRRYVIYSSAILARGREDICVHQIDRANKTLVTFRAIRKLPWLHAFIANNPVAKEYISSLDNCYMFPLYLYPIGNENNQDSLFEVSNWPKDLAHGGRKPNLNPEFVAEMEQKLGLVFQPVQPDLTGFQNLSGLEFGPEDIFHYIYAIFHSPTYRQRYAEFLKIDFPRVSLTSDVSLFRTLCALGKQLVALHLLEAPAVAQFLTRYPIAGDNRVEKGYPKYVPPKEEQNGRVHINQNQYFEGIAPEVWEFYVGGYQVLSKWLKDRRGRQLAYDDLTHYQQIIVALHQTILLMAEIDNTIPHWPIE